MCGLSTWYLLFSVQCFRFSSKCIAKVLVLEDADAGIFEDVVDAYRLLADRTEEIILEDFLSAVKNSLWSYHPINRRKSASSIHESDTLKEVTPSLIKSIEIIDRGLEIFQTHLAEALFKSLLLRVFANLRDLAKWSPTDWELGVESTFLKRGATFM